MLKNYKYCLNKDFDSLAKRIVVKDMLSKW
jgi:recombinational DNA repair protein RecT